MNNMKTVSIIVATLLGFVVAIFECQAQDFEGYHMVPRETFVETLPKAELYALPDNITSAVERQAPSFISNQRDIVNIEDIKPKMVRKSQKLRVVRLTNVTTKQGLDAYIVEYKDKLWLLRDCDVEDNMILHERNSLVLQRYAQLEKSYNAQQSRLVALKAESDSLDNSIKALRAAYMQECQDSLNYYQVEQKRLLQVQDSLVVAAYAQERARVDKEHKKWYNSLPASAKVAAGALRINYHYLHSRDYFGGWSYDLNITNMSSKTIKYVTWTAVLHNAVGDRVPCDIRGNEPIKRRITGPLISGCKGSYRWNNIVYSFDASYIYFTKIEIIYMDGSTVSFTGRDLMRVDDEPSTEVRIDERQVKNMVRADLDRCSDSIYHWSGRLSVLRAGSSFTKASNTTEESINSAMMRYDSVQTAIKATKSAELKASKEYGNFGNFLTFNRYTSASGASGSSSSTSSNTQTAAPVAKSPLVRFGVEASLEGLKSFSAGVGPIMRIGRSDNRFNSTIAVKYQTTACWDDAAYTMSDSYFLTEYTARYKQKAHELVVPIVLNWNYARDTDFCMFLGVGYEHGFLLAKKDEFLNMDSNFNVDDFWMYGDSQNWRNLSIPTRAIILQTGIGSDAFVIKVYYKIYVNRSKFSNGTPGALGAAMAIYF